MSDLSAVTAALRTRAAALRKQADDSRSYSEFTLMLRAVAQEFWQLSDMIDAADRNQESQEGTPEDGAG